MMNKVILIGRLTRDPELRRSNTGMAVCNFSVAVNRGFAGQNNEPQTDFINCVCFDKQAENLSRYMTKGRLISVDGRIQSRSYDNQEGKRVYVTEVVATNIQYLESKSATQGTTNNYSNNNSYNNAPSNDVTPFDFEQASSAPTVEVDNDPFASFGESVEISDNDLPF
jgi:single-strand DNA-binding protein